MRREVRREVKRERERETETEREREKRTTSSFGKQTRVTNKQTNKKKTTMALLGNTVGILVEFNVEDLELHYPRLRFK